MTRISYSFYSKRFFLDKFCFLWLIDPRRTRSSSLFDCRLASYLCLTIVVYQIPAGSHSSHSPNPQHHPCQIRIIVDRLFSDRLDHIIGFHSTHMGKLYFRFSICNSKQHSTFQQVIVNDIVSYSPTIVWK